MLHEYRTNTCGILGTPTPQAAERNDVDHDDHLHTPGFLPAAPYNSLGSRWFSKADPTRSASIVFVLNSNTIYNLKFNLQH